MNAKDFQRIALSFEGAEEGSHMGAVDFRVGGRIFATLAAVKQGYGNLMLDAEQQAAFVEEMPGVFLAVAGDWGRTARRTFVWRRRARTCCGALCRRRGSCALLRMRRRGRRGREKDGVDDFCEVCR